MTNRLNKIAMVSLWDRLLKYEFDGIIPLNLVEQAQEIVGFGHPHLHAFTHKLMQSDFAKKNGWTKQYTQRVINEYKKFCFLAVVCDHPVTPSLAVDEAWHIHIMFTLHYADFCDDVLHYDLHHSPGLSIFDHSYDQQYLKTIAAYVHHFGEVPPQDIWPTRAMPTLEKKEGYYRLKDDYVSTSSRTDDEFTPLYLIWDSETPDGTSFQSHDYHEGFGHGGEFGGGGAAAQWNDTHYTVDHDIPTYGESHGHDTGHSDADAGSGHAGCDSSSSCSSCSSCGGD